MSVQEFKVEQNTGHVAQATGDMSAAQIDEIKRQALAQVTSVREETSKLESAQKATGNSDAKVYGDIAMEAMGASGLKMLSTATEMIDTRMGDARASQGHSQTGASAAPAARTIEKDISGANRVPGFYNAEVETQQYGGAAKMASTPVDFQKLGMGLLERAGHVGFSMQAERGTGNLSTWDQGSLGKMDATKNLKESLDLENRIALSKQITFASDIANQRALDSTVPAYAHLNAARAHAAQMVPGMGMNMNGPSIRAADLLSEVRDYRDSSSSAGQMV